MKIVGFAQLHEELRRGFLPWWMESMERVCDVIYIWDQDSRDGSREFYRQHPKCVVIEHDRNDFMKEMICKTALLSKLLDEQQDADWIFWMDGDTVLEERAHDEIRGYLADTEFDNVLLPHMNLWRGNSHHRVDSGFDSLLSGLAAFWRVVPGLNLTPARGLHKRQYPEGTRVKGPYHMLHMGFATDQALAERMTTGPLPRRDPNPTNHKRHYVKPVLRPVPDEMLPPYIPRRTSCARQLTKEELLCLS